MRTIINSIEFFWALLAIPGAALLYAWSTGAIAQMDMIAPTGEMAARLMVCAMVLGPLAGVIGPHRWLLWLLARRRALGVAAFAYALFHLGFYLADMVTLAAVLAELPIASIWTGWLALALMLPMALTSNQAAMRRLRTVWKQVQRLAYPVALLTLLHWLWIHDGATEAALHFLPLALVWLALIARRVCKTRILSQPGV